MPETTPGNRSAEFVYRPRFGMIVTAITVALCAVGLGLVLVQDGIAEAARLLPWLVLIGGACWALFWRPKVTVSDGGVQLVNPLRTVDLPWPSIQLIDTKWALALRTSYGTYTAWAAPAPSRMQARKLTRGERGSLPESTFIDGDAIRPGDAPDAPSGAVAMVIRRRWERLRDAGHLDAPVLEHERAPQRWHLRTIGAGIALVAIGLLTALI